MKATAEVSKTIHNLEEQITSFERQKLHDMKSIFLDFVSTEMGYHAKAIELLTKAYQDVDAIDEEADMQVMFYIIGTFVYHHFLRASHFLLFSLFCAIYLHVLPVILYKT